MKIEEIKATKPSWSVAGAHVEKLRVAAYCRVSKDDSEQLLSYDSQKQHYTNLISEKTEWQLSGIYADVITGTQVAKRVNFQKLIDDAMNGEIDMIFCQCWPSYWVKCPICEYLNIARLQLLYGNGHLPCAVTQSAVNPGIITGPNRITDIVVFGIGQYFHKIS